MDPWEEFLNYRATDRNFCDFTEGETAQWLTIQASHRARRLCDGVEGIRLMTIHRKLVIVVQEKLAVTIKKLREQWNPRTGKIEIVRSNYLTERNRRLWNQERGEESIDYPRILLGYMLSREITQIKVLLAYARTRCLRVEWATPMPSQPPVVSTVFSPRSASDTDEQPVTGFSIGPADCYDQEKDTGTE